MNVLYGWLLALGPHGASGGKGFVWCESPYREIVRRLVLKKVESLANYKPRSLISSHRHEKTILSSLSTV